MTMPRLSRLAGWLYWLSTLSLIIFPIVVIASALWPELFDISGPAGQVPPAKPWTAIIWAGIAVSLIPHAFTLMALVAMRQLFALYRGGDPLAPAAALLIRRIGANLLAAGVLGFLVMPLCTVLFTLSNPPGERMVAVGISNGDVGFVLVAGLMFLIGWSMTEASRVAEENKGFV